MIAIAIEDVKDNITWNRLAEITHDVQAKKWLGPITNSLGQYYLWNMLMPCQYFTGSGVVQS